MEGASTVVPKKRPRLDESYIRVQRCLGDIIGIPLSENEPLKLSVLEHLLPYAYGLVYPNQTAGGCSIGVMYDEETKCFLPPNGAWSYKIVYQVVYKDNRSPSPYSFIQGQLPQSAELNKFCFYIFNESGLKGLATRIYPKMFASYRHGSHKKYNLDQQISVFSFVDDREYTTVVKHIDDKNDFILLQSETIVGGGPKISDIIRPAQQVILCGHCTAHKQEKLSYETGCIYSSKLIKFKGSNNEETGPFLICSVTSKPGDSGGGVYDSDGLIGLNVAYVEPSHLYSETNAKQNFINASIYKVRALLVPIENILDAMNRVCPVESDPAEQLSVILDGVEYTNK